MYVCQIKATISIYSNSDGFCCTEYYVKALIFSDISFKKNSLVTQVFAHTHTHTHTHTVMAEVSPLRVRTRARLKSCCFAPPVVSPLSCTRNQASARRRRTQSEATAVVHRERSRGDRCHDTMVEDYTIIKDISVGKCASVKRTFVLCCVCVCVCVSACVCVCVSECVRCFVVLGMHDLVPFCCLCVCMCVCVCVYVCVFQSLKVQTAAKSRSKCFTSTNSLTMPNCAVK